MLRVFPHNACFRICLWVVLRGVSHAAYYKKEICSINTIDQAMKLIDDIKRDLK